MSFSTPKCCICLENENIYTSCPSCKDGKYCESCINELIKTDNYSKCSICRTKKWYENNDEIIILIAKHKNIGISLDDHQHENLRVDDYNDSDSDNDNDNNNNNHYFSSCRLDCSIWQLCPFGLLLSVNMVFGWVILFGLYELDINAPDKYKNLLIMLISLACGVTMSLVSVGLIVGCGKLNEYTNGKCCHVVLILIVSVIVISLVSLIGYCFTFDLCELKSESKFTENIFITMLISFSTGLAMCLILYILVISHKLLYKCCKIKFGEEKIIVGYLVGCCVCIIPTFTILFALSYCKCCSRRDNEVRDDSQVSVVTLEVD